MTKRCCGPDVWKFRWRSVSHEFQNLKSVTIYRPVKPSGYVNTVHYLVHKLMYVVIMLWKTPSQEGPVSQIVQNVLHPIILGLNPRANVAFGDFFLVWFGFWGFFFVFEILLVGPEVFHFDVC